MCAKRTENFSPAVEDYLKSIYEITQLKKRAETLEIASRLGLKPSSVTLMLQKMADADPPLIQYEKYRGAVLTGDGEKTALKTLRQHRLLETYLHDVLDLGWDQVHEEADRLEHSISDVLEERIAQKLGNPEYDPHGAPIPSKNLKMPSSSSLRLLDLVPGETAKICRVQDRNAEVLRYLEGAGLVPGAEIFVEEIIPLDQSFLLRISGKDQHVHVGLPIAALIHVERTQEYPV
ncbi:MAG: metal-dependent transcriptional regulator [Anaerolineales bacterium]|nr:metal-dependent transcriptional regulator [Anaerolineales bacterium]